MSRNEEYNYYFYGVGVGVDEGDIEGGLREGGSEVKDD